MLWQIRTIWDLQTPGQDEDILWTVFCLAFFDILSWQSVMMVHLIICTAQLMMKNLAVDNPSNPSSLYQPFPEHLLLLSHTSVSSVGKEKQRALLLASRNQVAYHCCDLALIWPISPNQQKYAAMRCKTDLHQRHIMNTLAHKKHSGKRLTQHYREIG